MRLRILREAAGFAALIVMASGLALGQVRTDYNHHTNFSQFQTWSWGRVRADNPLVAQRIHKAVNILMEKKGFEKAQSGGQLTIFAMANVQNQKEAQTLYDGWGGGWGMGWGWGGWGCGGRAAASANRTRPLITSRWGIW